VCRHAVVNNGNVARIANNLNTNRSQRCIAVYPERSRGDELNHIKTAESSASATAQLTPNQTKALRVSRV